jgi:hypothetical protein
MHPHPDASHKPEEGTIYGERPGVIELVKLVVETLCDGQVMGKGSNVKGFEVAFRTAKRRPVISVRVGSSVTLVDLPSNAYLEHGAAYVIELGRSLWSGTGLSRTPKEALRIR